MTIYEFLSDRFKKFIFEISVVLIAAVFLLSTGTQFDILLLLLIGLSFLFLIVQIFDFLRSRSHLQELEAILSGLNEKYLFAECVPISNNLYERKLFELIRHSGKAMIEAVSDAQASQREYREYIESWVHEIKSPITAAKLICRTVDEPMRRKLSCELSQIDAHVERALFYARAESPEQDFLIRKINLSAIVSQAIQNHQSLLIQSNIQIQTQGLDQIIYTDDKWSCFILGQLLQNAVRYRSEQPIITLSAKPLGQQIQLSVQDNGIGIPAHELSRVFDRGFTGSNGRKKGGSTGMGLYLCRKLTNFLEINLSITSKEHQGTTITLTFPAKER